jgi:ABC-2 type transport system permease protein
MSTRRVADLRAELRVVRGLSLRWFREVTISPVGLTVMLAIKPVLWYLLFGSLFQQITMLPGFPAENYKAFILPGVAALMAIEYVVIGGKCVVDDISTGFIGKLWAAPVSRSSVVGARIVVMATLNAVQTTLLLGLAYADGVRLATGLPGAVAFVGLAALMAVAATAFSLFVAYALKYEFAFSMVTSFLVLPVLFVSNAFVPISAMPAWLGTLADWNPVSIAISGMRTLALDGWVWADVAPAVGLLVALALGFGTVTAWTFTRTLESEADLLAAVTLGR